jgi:hypothetical protein
MKCVIQSIRIANLCIWSSGTGTSTETSGTVPLPCQPVKKLDPGRLRSIGAASVIPEAICLPEIDASSNSFNYFQIDTLIRIMHEFAQNLRDSQ